jgi:large subunit ribosomal protein L21
MKYAIINSGGKQYVAKEGETIEVDRMPLQVGDDVQWKEVLLFANNGDVVVGDPFVTGANVTGKVVEQIKGRKILVFKYIPRERYRRRRGHRQRYTRVEIDKISLRKPRKKDTESTAEEKKAEAKKSTSSASKSSKSTKKAESAE